MFECFAVGAVVAQAVQITEDERRFREHIKDLPPEEQMKLIKERAKRMEVLQFKLPETYPARQDSGPGFLTGLFIGLLS